MLFLNTMTNDRIKEILKEILAWLKTIAIALLIAFFIKFFIIDLTRISGSSMENTLFTDDLVVIEKISTNITHKYKRGDVIIFHSPTEDKLYVKRIVGLPGEEVELIDGKFYINENELDEPYYTTGSFTESKDENYWFLTDDEYFMVGDNRPKSNDSRKFGPVQERNFVGRAFFRIFPFNEMKKLN